MGREKKTPISDKLQQAGGRVFPLKLSFIYVCTVQDRGGRMKYKKKEEEDSTKGNKH